MIVTVAVDERCIGEDGCLWLYPLPEWEKLELTISKLPTLNKMAGKLRRFVIGNASECEMDGQGRLLLPERLRESARIVDEVVIFGKLSMLSVAGRDQFERDLQVASPLSPEDQVQLAGILKKS